MGLTFIWGRRRRNDDEGEGKGEGERREALVVGERQEKAKCTYSQSDKIKDVMFLFCMLVRVLDAVKLTTYYMAGPSFLRYIIIQ